MKLKKFWLITAVAIPLLMPVHGLAQGRTSTGYLSSLTFKALVLDGVSYRFRPNREEREPVEVQCAVQENKIDCEQLAWISQGNRVRAEVTFDGAGLVTRVNILDAPNKTR